MVYAGKPSTGCQTCRNRHIKCDEARPHCRACVRSGRSCPGYKDPFDVMLRGQKAFLRKHGTSRSTRLSNGASSRQDSPVSMASGSSGAEHTEVEDSPQSRAIIQAAKPSQSAQIMTPSIPAGPYIPLEDIVAPLFFNSYLYVPKDPQIAHGYMWLLPEAFSNARSGSHLHLATLSVSFFSVAAWTGQRSLLRSSEELFLKALPRTREALQHDVDHNLHDVLLTILLLNAYEEFHAMKERSLPPNTHLRGAVALVNSRRPAQPDSPNSKILAHAIQTQIARTSLGAAHPVVQAPNLWPSSTPMGPTAPSQLTIAASQLVNLRLTWDELTSRPQTPTNGEIADILSKANYLDAQLATWTYCLPSPWTPIPATTIPAAVREAGLFQGRCDCYQDMWIASVWNFYRGTRISLQHITLNCLRMLQHDDTSPETQSTLSIIRNLTTDICSSVPFFLGSQTAPVQFNPNVVEYPEAQERRTTPAHRQSAPLLGGWFVLAYLGHVCSPWLGLDEEQLEWIQGQMRRVLRIYSFESRSDG